MSVTLNVNGKDQAVDADLDDVLEGGAPHRIGDLVRHLVGVTLGDGLGSKDVTAH